MAKLTYLITGAANGFGRALSLQLAKLGGNLVLLDKDKRGLNELYDEVVGIEGCEPALYPMNLAGAQVEDYAALGNTLDKEFDGLDVLIHNAAQFNGLTPQSHTNTVAWLETLQTNLNAPFFLTQACMGLLRESQNGKLLFIGDQFAPDELAYRGAYAVSKTALTTYMQILAEETEQEENLTVTAFNPGVMETSFLSKIYPGHPMGSLPAIELIAEECIALLQAPKNEVHGQTIQTTQGCLHLA